MHSIWPCGEEAGFWSVQLNSAGLWLADKISWIVCPITIRLYRPKACPLITRPLSLHRSYVERVIWPITGQNVGLISTWQCTENELDRLQHVKHTHQRGFQPQLDLQNFSSFPHIQVHRCKEMACWQSLNHRQQQPNPKKKAPLILRVKFKSKLYIII